MTSKSLIKKFLIVPAALLFMAGCTTGKGFSVMGTPTANQLFKDYYTALTGTMSASTHHDNYHWRGGSEPFPYKDHAKWTDLSVNTRSCDNKDIARFYGSYDTFNQGLGYTNPQEATDKVAAYWQSQGWKVTDISNPKEPDFKDILATTDTNINLRYIANSRGEAIEASTECIPELYNPENPAEEPITYQAIQPSDINPTDN